MDPLRLIEIVQDGDFSRVRQLVHEHFPVSPESTEQEHQTQKERMQKRNHPWKSPMQRYRNKQLGANYDEDEDLEELSWKHRSKAYDLRKSDVISKRVYHSDEEYNDGPNYPSKTFRTDVSSGKHFTDKRPKSIETASATKIFDEQVITPATIPMDEDEFDSPYSAGSTPTSVSLLDSSPSVVTPPKAILDQLAMDHKESEGTEVTLKMFQDARISQEGLESIQKEKDPEKVEGAVKKILERRSGVKQLIEEHERLMAETQKSLATTPDRNTESNSMALRKNKFRYEESISSPTDEEEAAVEKSTGHGSGEKFEGSLTTQNKIAPEEQYATEVEHGNVQIDEPMVILDDEDENETFLPRSSILTTIVEESTPLKVSSPLTVSPEKIDNNSKITEMKNEFGGSNIVTPEKIEEDNKVTYTRKEFKEKRITQLNKVTIAAALIEFNEILMEESDHLHKQKLTNDSRLIKAIMKHRKTHGFFTGATPTHESLKNGAATIIQASCRQFLAIRYARRKVDIARTFAATLIQTQWRAHDSRMNYEWYRGSAVIIQAKWKSCLFRKKYNSLRSSAISVQSIARMYRCKTKFLRQKSSATSLQNKWRSHTCQKQYHSLRTSTILVQSIRRMHQCQKTYLQQKASAIAFQANWRSYICQRQYNLMRTSTIMIQSIARMHQSQENFIQRRSSARIAQTKWRSYSCQKQYGSMRSSSIMVQSIARMHLCRNKYLQHKESAKIVQTKWRSYTCQKQYMSMRSSSIAIQSIARMHHCRTNFREHKASSTLIQAASRMFFCRKNFLECKKAATILQSASRMYLCLAKYLKHKRAATTLQAALRMHICHSKYHQCKKSVIQFQSLSRMYLCLAKYRDQKRAIVTLQAAQRMNFCRSKHAQSKKAATVLQSLSRMRTCRNYYLNQKSASTTLQAATRMYLCRSNYVERMKSVIIMQAGARAYLCRAIYLNQQRAAITLQGVVRMHLSRRKYHDHQSAAVVVQYAFRKFMRQKDYATFEAIREVQAQWRSSVYRSDHMALMEIKRIPTSHRTSICKRNFMHYLSSTIIQKGWRTYNDRKTFEAARCIQARWRAFILQKKWNTIKASASCIQTRWRAFVCQKDYENKLMSVICLQARLRGFLCGKNFASRRASATLIQSSYRAYICKKNHRLTIESATKLQSMWRSYSCKKEYLCSLTSAIKLQTSFRAYACRKSYDSLVSNRAATKLESLARMYLCQARFIQHKASRTIQAAARMHLCRSQLLACCKAVTTIQTVFRGYACRKEYALYLNSVKADEKQHKKSVQSNKVQIGEGNNFKEHSENGVLATNMPLNGEDGEFDDDDERIFLGRSSTLTTIVEERYSLGFLSPPLESRSVLAEQNEEEAEEQKLPTTVKKKRPNVALEENLQEDNYKIKDPLQIQENDQSILPVSKSEQVEDRRTSEERLMALAAKVAAKRRASLSRNRVEITTKDPWQKKIELQKKSKPVLLSKRMGELEKLANQKRVSSSRWNTKEGQNKQPVGIANNRPLARYPEVFGNRKTNETKAAETNDSVVKKLFESDGNDDVIPNAINFSEPILENETAALLEINDVDDENFEIHIEDGNEEAIDSASYGSVRDVTSDDLNAQAQFFETDVDKNNVVLNEESESSGEIFADYERKGMIRSWERQSIVDDLADDVFDYDFDTDSDSDYESLSSDDAGSESVNDQANGDFDGARVHEKEGENRPAREWAIVDDLIDDEDAQNESLDSDDDDDVNDSINGRKNQVSLQSPVAISKIRKEHPLWNMSGEDVSGTISSSFYTVAGIAASLIGMGE